MKLPEWLNLLVLGACFVTNFSIQSSAISTLLDLMGVTQAPNISSHKDDTSDEDEDAERPRDETWHEESLNTIVRRSSSSDNTVTVVIIPPLSPQQLRFLHLNSRFYQVSVLTMSPLLLLSQTVPSSTKRCFIVIYTL